MIGGTGRLGFEGLDACVHCGFCLQACPTFLATGDESDSPRGRIELMRGLERGDIAVTDAALLYHLDRCLGCRGCEPVCPSGVQYGRGLEAARSRITAARGASPLTRLALWTLTRPGISGVVYRLARFLRATGLPRLFAGWGRLGFSMGMLAATTPKDAEGRRRTPKGDLRRPLATSGALLFRGCVMQGLFSHVHDATVRTLGVNGYNVREVPGQVCCGALHAHAGVIDEARELARKNVAAFGDGDEPIVVNSAGCGALMKEYGHLLGDERGVRFAARVRDVTELLDPPAAGAPLDLHVAYDPPCHLVHAQRIVAQPLQLFAAIPLLELVAVAGASECCGSAGLFTLLEPEMSRAVLKTKLEHIRAAAPQVVATGNPGCIMQLGAGLAAARSTTRVRHPVELLDDSYRAAGRYG